MEKSPSRPTDVFPAVGGVAEKKEDEEKKLSDTKDEGRRRKNSSGEKEPKEKREGRQKSTRGVCALKEREKRGGGFNQMEETHFIAMVR